MQKRFLDPVDVEALRQAVRPYLARNTNVITTGNGTIPRDDTPLAGIFANAGAISPVSPVVSPVSNRIVVPSPRYDRIYQIKPPSYENRIVDPPKQQTRVHYQPRPATVVGESLGSLTVTFSNPKIEASNPSNSGPSFWKLNIADGFELNGSTYFVRWIWLWLWRFAVLACLIVAAVFSILDNYGQWFTYMGSWSSMVSAIYLVISLVCSVNGPDAEQYRFQKPTVLQYSIWILWETAFSTSIFSGIIFWALLSDCYGNSMYWHSIHVNGLIGLLLLPDALVHQMEIADAHLLSLLFAFFALYLCISVILIIPVQSTVFTSYGTCLNWRESRTIVTVCVGVLILAACWILLRTLILFRNYLAVRGLPTLTKRFMKSFSNGHTKPHSNYPVYQWNVNRRKEDEIVIRKDVMGLGGSTAHTERIDWNSKDYYGPRYRVVNEEYDNSNSNNNVNNVIVALPLPPPPPPLIAINNGFYACV